MAGPCFLFRFGAMNAKNIKSWPGLLGLSILLLPTVFQGPTFSRLSIHGGLAAFFILSALWSVTHPDIEKGVQRFFVELGGVVYLGVLGAQLLLLHGLKSG